MASTLLELTASIVSSHAATVEMSSDEMLQEIQKVHHLLKQLDEGLPLEKASEPSITVALAPKKSIQKHQVICLICEKEGFKTLARHLKQAHNMTPAQYRKQAGLPAGIPLVAKSYSESRREQALKNNQAGNLVKARAARKANAETQKAAAPKIKAAPKTKK